MPRQVETNIGNLTFLRSDLVYLKLNNKQHIKVEDGVIFRNMFKEVVEHEIGIIADARDVQVSASPSSMRFFTTDPTFNKFSGLKFFRVHNGSRPRIKSPVSGNIKHSSLEWNCNCSNIRSR